MVTYFFTMNQENRRGERIAKVTGVIQAESEDEAYEKAWALAGNDMRCKVEVHEVDLTKGFTFVVYKSEI